MRNNPVIGILMFLVPVLLYSGPLFEYRSHETVQEDSMTYAFTVDLSADGSYLTMDLSGNLSEGSLNVWIGGGGFEVIASYTDEGIFEYKNTVFGPLRNTQPISIRVTALNAVGNWDITLTEITRRNMSRTVLYAAILILLVILGAILFWRKTMQSSLRWLLPGVVAWVVGVALKFGWAYLMNARILAWLQSKVSHVTYLVTGSIYVGVLTGVFEIGLTLFLVLKWKSAVEKSDRAVGMGIGAGSIEALLISLSQIASYFILMSGIPQSDVLWTQIAQTIAATPALTWLLSPVERTLALLCHTSSRVLVAYAIRHKRQSYFWAGFLIMTGIDTIAGYVHIAGLMNKVSLWYVECAILPFALISIPIIKWCVVHWNSMESTTERMSV